MTQEEILEGKRGICIFVNDSETGQCYSNFGDFIDAKYCGGSEGEGIFLNWSEMKFNISFDWLIRVINECYRRIEQDKIVYTDDNMLALTALKNCLTPSLNNKIEISRAFMMLTDFIKWYNAQK